MNAKRRKALEAIAQRIEDAQNDLAALYDEEVEYRDGIPENMQDGDKMTAAIEACDALETANDMLSDAINSIHEAIES